jgi:hypothetical protein
MISLTIPNGGVENRMFRSSPFEEKIYLVDTTVHFEYMCVWDINKCMVGNKPTNAKHWRTHKTIRGWAHLKKLLFPIVIKICQISNICSQYFSN